MNRGPYASSLGVHYESILRFLGASGGVVSGGPNWTVF